MEKQPKFPARIKKPAEIFNSKEIGRLNLFSEGFFQSKTRFLTR